MSIAETTIDCVKTDEIVGKSISSPTPPLVTKEVPIEMEVDASEKSENQNGSKSSIKEDVESKVESLPKGPKLDEPIKETQPTLMEVDMPNNGTSVENNTKSKETETIGEDLKTDEQVHGKQDPKVSEEKEISEKLETLEVSIKIDDLEKKNSDQEEMRDVIDKKSDGVENLDQEKTKDQVENKDHENEDKKISIEDHGKIEDHENNVPNKIASESKIDDGIHIDEILKKNDVTIKEGDESKLENSELSKNEDNSKSENDSKNKDQLKDDSKNENHSKIEDQSKSEELSKDEEKAMDQDDEMITEETAPIAKAKDELNEDQLLSEDHEMTDHEMTQNESKIGADTSREYQELSESMYIDEGTYFQNEKIVELSRCSWTSNSDKQQYVRGCLWSPDGTCILTAVNMDGMHVINLPNDLYSNETVSPDRPLDILQSVIHVKESGTVYDYCWYPFMNSTMPETCCWISSRQHCPIQLWDGFDGELRGSYRGYDNVDEVEAAFSVTFTSDAEKIIGGYKKTLKIFDTKVPGREYSIISIKQPCSCFAVQATQSDIIATGSWNCSINLYDLRTPKFGSLVTLTEHVGGVTFLKFSATGDSLFSGARKDNALYEWDMRNFTKPIRKLERNVKTNQRIYFDLSCGERWLASGDTDGLVHVWDLIDGNSTKEFQFSLHNDCCNGVSFHPARSMLATCSGQFHFLDDQNIKDRTVKMYENSLIFWWFGNTTDNGDENDEEKKKENAADENEKMKPAYDNLTA